MEIDPKTLARAIRYLEDYYSTFGCDENGYKDFYIGTQKRYHTSIKNLIDDLKGR